MRLSPSQRLEHTAALLDLVAKSLDPHDRVKPRVPALDRITDPVARLNFIAELLKAGFDPDQPRDERGRWTGEGSGDANRLPPDMMLTSSAKPPETKPNSQKPSDNRIHMWEIANEQKTPIKVLDDQGREIQGPDGKPLYGPKDLPPAFFVEQGLQAADILNSDPTNPAAGMAFLAHLAAKLPQFGQGGSWDAERVNGKYVVEYHDYATVAIGLYCAAAGIPLEDCLTIQNEYAGRHSTHRDGSMHETYRDLPERNVADTELGYQLFQSGLVGSNRAKQ